MPDEVYPIIVNQNPVLPKKPKTSFVKLFITLTIVIVVLTGAWYLIQNKPWQKFTVQEDPTIKQQKTQAHGEVWMGFLELDTTTNIARLREEPRITNSDLFAPIITKRPQLGEGEWAFEVVVENRNREIVYRSYRIMSIFPGEDNPKIWDFAVAIPYTSGGILQILDLNQKQIFVEQI